MFNKILSKFLMWWDQYSKHQQVTLILASVLASVFLIILFWFISLKTIFVIGSIILFAGIFGRIMQGIETWNSHNKRRD